MRTYGQQAMRGLGATTFLGFFGTTAALIPVALFSLVSTEQPAHWTLFAGAAVVGGAAIGWVLRK
jgi:VIT1/CCC1 family predicted Fe2+/Mn2+ transporter